jgi:dTDP-4-amino-4,6-dideoxygalactose transaminase
MAETLAIQGGTKSVTIEELDRWEKMTDTMVAEVERAVASNAVWSEGQKLARDVEGAFAEMIGANYAVSQHNGTSTLWSSYFALGVGLGDEVIHPNFTWICSVAPTYMLGARPVFAEIDPKTFLIDPEDIEKRITKNTKAIVAVHWGGNVCDMAGVMDVADRHGIPVVEDCSHAHGAKFDGKSVGTIGAMGAFSFQGVPGQGKPVSGGEAGMVTTMDRYLYERVLLFAHGGREGLADELRDSRHSQLAPFGLGMNFRAHPLGLAIAKVQLTRVREQNEKRLAYIRALNDGLADIPGVDPLYVYPKAEPAGWYSGMQARYRPGDLGGLPRSDFVAAVRAEGVQIKEGADVPDRIGPSGHQPYHMLPLFARGFDLYTHGRGPLWEGYEGYEPDEFPQTREALAKMLTLPVLTDPDDGVVDQFLTAFRKVGAHYAA